VKIYVRTFGCTFNKFDSELIEYALKSRNYQIVSDEKEADIIIVNTCGVKKQTEDKIISYLKKLRLLGKRVIVTGCLPLINPERIVKETGFKELTGPSIGEIIIDLIEQKIDPKTLLRNDLKPPLSRRCYNNGVIHITPIAHGCIGSCSYCAVKLARGKLRSYSEDEIIQDIKNAVESGAKEIWLTAQDTGCYGIDINTNLISLLEKVEQIKGTFKVRLGMCNPSSIYPYLDDLKEFFERSEKFFYFLHIPVQSGSNRVLKLMNRKYQISQFEEIVQKMRSLDNKFTIVTDIIVGFPGETDQDFEETVKLIKNVKPDMVNISKFFPRPGTKAAKMKQIPSQIIKNRSRLLTELCNQMAIERNKLWLGWRGEVIVDEYGKANSLVARNYAYKPIILFPSRDSLIGNFINVKITEVSYYWLRGDLIAS